MNHEERILELEKRAAALEAETQGRQEWLEKTLNEMFGKACKKRLDLDSISS